MASISWHKLTICLLTLSATAFLAACTTSAPDCTETKDTNVQANAGCLVINQGQLLLVIEPSGKISLPGGGQSGDESARCTAARETWEETGLLVNTANLERTFANGFHLYSCSLKNESDPINPPQGSEIKEALWLAPDRFADYQWRFPEQRQWLADWIAQANAESAPK